MNWIKCSEKLPDESMKGHAIAIFGKKSKFAEFVIQTAYIPVDWKDLDLLHYEYNFFFENKKWTPIRFLPPTHWMPMPQPPKE